MLEVGEGMPQSRKKIMNFNLYKLKRYVIAYWIDLTIGNLIAYQNERWWK
jgi:hypothetical protein